MLSSGYDLAGRMHGYFGNTRETQAVREHIKLIEHEPCSSSLFRQSNVEGRCVLTPLEQLIADSNRRATAEAVLETIG